MEAPRWNSASSLPNSSWVYFSIRGKSDSGSPSSDMMTYSGKFTATSWTKSHSPPAATIWSTYRLASSSTRTFIARMAFGRNQSAPIARTTRC